MIRLSNNILQIHYFGSKCMIKTNQGLVLLNSLVSHLVALLNQHLQLSVDDITIAIINEFHIQGSFDEVKNIVENHIYNVKGIKSLFCQASDENKSSKKVLTSGFVGRYVPYVLNIELTNVCNLHCSHCYKEANSYIPAYMNLDALSDLFAFLKSRNLSITLTGGEPTLHPSFDMAVKICSQYGNVDLVTNGLNLLSVNDKTLNEINLLGISLYGLNDMEYFQNTGTNRGFSKLENSVKYLQSLKKEFTISIVLDQNKIKNLERYVEIAEKFGAASFQVGLPSKSGNLIRQKSGSEHWNLTESDIKDAYRKIRILQNAHKSKIKILDWERDIYETTYKYNDLSNPANFYPPHCMKCGAGTTQWTVSEDFRFRPCNLLTNDFVKILDYNTFKKYVNGEYFINWEKTMKDYEQIYSQNGYKLSDCCKRMTDFLYEDKG